MSYPVVRGELETLDLVAAGRSIARYGDGEFNLCRGGRAKAQRHHIDLEFALCAMLRDAGQCLVGIPNLQSPTPKAAFWAKYRRFPLPQREYVSAFITRPDSAPWIDTPAYWALVASLWAGQRVTLVRGTRRSLTAADLVGADVTEVIGPAEDAWAAHDALLAQVLDTRPSRVLLCLGPTATVLAVELCAAGIHAIDVGHLGMFWKKHRRSEPMTVTAADKVSA